MLISTIEKQYNFTFLIKTILLISILLGLKLYLVYSWSYFNYYIPLFCIPNIAVLVNMQKKRLLNFLIAFTIALLFCATLVFIGAISKRSITYLILLSTTSFFIFNYKYVYKNHLLEQNTSFTNYLHILFTMFITIPILDIFYFIKIIPIFEIQKVFLFCAALLFCFFCLFSLITILVNLKPVHQKQEEYIKDHSSLSNEIKISKGNLLDKTKATAIKKEKLTKEALDILDFFENTNLFLDPDFTIDELAKEIEIPKHILSKIINHEMNLNFYSLLAKYRIEYAKELIFKEKNLLLDGVMAEAGFNSRITFNKYFKEFTGLTPSEYRNLLHKSC